MPALCLARRQRRRGGDERAEVALPIQGGSLQEQKRGHKKDPL